MGLQRTAAQAASEIRTGNKGVIKQVDFPLLNGKHDFRIRFSGTLPNLAKTYGINCQLPTEKEHQVELATPLDRVCYSLFVVEGELDAFFLVHGLKRIGWHPATALILLHFGVYIPAKAMGRSIVALGSRYVQDKTMEYPKLTPVDCRWEMHTCSYNPDHQNQDLYYLAWR